MSVLWQNPWAWFGIGSVALPILIHLLGRGHARVQKFPTLRFLDSSKLLPTRRTRIHDRLLLAIRVGVLTTAVAAFAQPWLRTDSRTQKLDAVLARAIIVDTSASVSSDVDGVVSRLVRESQASNVIRTAQLGRAIPTAIAWLDGQAGRREIVFVSDFQIEALDSSDIANIPMAIGVRADRVSSAQRASESVSWLDGNIVTARIDQDDSASSVEWTTQRTATTLPTPTVTAPQGEDARANAAIGAAGVSGVRLPIDSLLTSRVSIVAGQRGREAGVGGLPTSAWMIDLVIRLRADSALRQSAARSITLANDSGRGLPVIRAANGQPVVVATLDRRDTSRLMLTSAADAGSLTTAMLIASTRRALSRAAPLAELERSTTPESALSQWRREPASAIDNDHSINNTDARWLWALVLILLGAETWMRQGRREARAASAEARPRAA